MGKIKLYDIAKEFDMSSKDILAIAMKLNINAKSHLSSVSDEDAEKIRKEAKNANKQPKTSSVKKDNKKVADNKGATPVIIRREVIVEDTTKKSAIPEKKEDKNQIMLDL